MTSCVTHFSPFILINIHNKAVRSLGWKYSYPHLTGKGNWDVEKWKIRAIFMQSKGMQWGIHIRVMEQVRPTLSLGAMLPHKCHIGSGSVLLLRGGLLCEEWGRGPVTVYAGGGKSQGQQTQMHSLTVRTKGTLAIFLRPFFGYGGQFSNFI